MSIRDRAGPWPEILTDEAGEPALAVASPDVQPAIEPSPRASDKSSAFPPAAPPPAERSQNVRQSVTWPVLAAAMALVVVAVKLASLPFAVSSPGEFVRWLLRLDIVVAPDLSFVAGLVALCWLAERAAGEVVVGLTEGLAASLRRWLWPGGRVCGGQRSHVQGHDGPLYDPAAFICWRSGRYGVFRHALLAPWHRRRPDRPRRCA